jgi:hypothetical protein
MITENQKAISTAKDQSASASGVYDEKFTMASINRIYIALHWHRAFSAAKAKGSYAITAATPSKNHRPPVRRPKNAANKSLRQARIRAANNAGRARYHNGMGSN